MDEIFAQLYAIAATVPETAYQQGLRDGKMDKVYAQANISRPVGKRTYQPIPTRSVRKIKPPDARLDKGLQKHKGVPQRFITTRSVETMQDQEYAAGYAAGKMAEASTKAPSSRRQARQPDIDLKSWAKQDRADIIF